MANSHPAMLIAVAGRVNKKGKPSWFTRRRAVAAAKCARAYHDLGIPYDLAFVVSSANNGQAVMRQVLRDLCPFYDGVPLSPPDGLTLSKSKGERFIKRVGRVRGQIPLFPGWL